MDAELGPNGLAKRLPELVVAGDAAFAAVGWMDADVVLLPMPMQAAAGRRQFTDKVPTVHADTRT